jgi:hypothetical protein
MLEPIPWKRKYPFDTIPVGGQLVIPISHHGQRTTIASAARHFTKRYGWRFRTNLVAFDKHGVIETGKINRTGNAVRVTRIA